jgi:hypothetical protein
MTANPLAMLWCVAHHLITDGGQWLMVMPSLFLDQVTFGWITIPFLTVLMAWLMLLWVRLPSVSNNHFTHHNEVSLLILLVLSMLLIFLVDGS